MLHTWNAYFKARNIDIILTPGQFTNAVTYVDWANVSLPVRFRSGPGMPAVEFAGAGITGLFISFKTFKHVPIPKLMVPTGLDDGGRPTGVMLWGRGPPVEKLYDDVFARTFDLEFLYTAKALVDIIQSSPGLARQNAPLVAGLYQEPTSLTT